FSIYLKLDHLDLHSFPTRRSSDLYFDLQNSYFLILCLTAAVLFFLSIYFGSQFIDQKNIDQERKSIEKKESAEGLGTLLNAVQRSEEHTSELQSRENLVCRLLLEK